MSEVFRILVVCSGNVCRSPLAERLLRARLDAALGPEARRVEVASAGTSAMVGSAMDPRAAAVGKALGASSDGFVARAVTVADVADADLVLGAAREHRAAAVRLCPAAHRYTFTLREFARLSAAVPAEELPDLDPVHRARALVKAAAARRGVTRAPRPEDDDVPDPHGGQERVHREVGAVLDQVVGGAIAVIAGQAAPDADGASTAPRLRLRRGRPRRALTASSSAAGSGPSRTGTAATGTAATGTAATGTAGAAGRAGGNHVAVDVAGVADGRRGRAERAADRRAQRREAARSAPSTRPGRSAGRRRTARGRLRRVVLRSGLGVLALLVLGVGWLAVRGRQAQQELVAARTDVSGVRAAILTGDLDSARGALADAQRRTSRARELTGDPVWRLAAAAPYVGANPDAVRTVSAAVDDLTHDALPALLEAGAGLDPSRLRPSGDRIAVDAFARAAPVITAARTDVIATRAKVDAVAGAPLLPAVSRAVEELRTELAGTTSTLEGVGRASRLVPPMLGGEGKRRYLVIFQNNAEARATGGLVGAYAVVSANRGELKIERIGSNTDLESADTLPVDLGRDFRNSWGDGPALWVNGNVDANFPNAARIWLALWKKQTGQSLDGVLATDPVALSYLLRATGPVKLETGETIDSGNAVRLTMSDVYQRSDDNDVRDDFLRSVAGSVAEALVLGKGEPRAVLDQLSKAAGERRLLLYSAHEAEQKDITHTTLSGMLSRLAGPYAFVAVNNAGGNKMDYYLQRSIRYEAGSCAGGRRTSRLTVAFGNGAPDPATLPEYVSQRLDDARATRAQSESEGSVVLLVSVYGPLKGGVVDATLDGKPLSVSSGRSGPRPVWTFPLVIDQGMRRTVVLELLEPDSSSAPVVPVQPLVQPARVSTSAASCG